MTNLTDGQLKHCDKRIVEAFNKFISGEFSVALGRIKSLEDTILKLQDVVNEQKVVIDGQVTEIVNLKEKEPQMVPENAWNLIEKNPAVKSGIMNMVAMERKSSQHKEKNLVIFGVKETGDTEEIKDEVMEIMDVIGMKRIVKKPRITRFKSDGCITMELDSVETKMRVLRAAKELRTSDSYKKVYINLDLTKAEYERHKELRIRQIALNRDLPNGTGNLRHGLHKFDGEDGTETCFFWGIRRDQLVRIRKR